MGSHVPFLVEATLRDLRRSRAAGLGAFLLVFLAVLAAGSALILEENLERIVTGWREQVRIVLYLDEEPAQREEWLAGLRTLGGVREWRWISPDEAMGELHAYLGADGALLARLPSNPLPASVEIAPDPALSAVGLRALIRGLEALPGVEEVQGPGRWVEWAEGGRRVLIGLGLGLGGLLALVALLAVATASTFAGAAGREEATLARLVGATGATVRLPLILGGVIHGALGALAAVGLLVLAEPPLLRHLGPALREGLGLETPAFLGWREALALVLGGCGLGAFGGLLGGRTR